MNTIDICIKTSSYVANFRARPTKLNASFDIRRLSGAIDSHKLRELKYLCLLVFLNLKTPLLLPYIRIYTYIFISL